MKKKFIFIKVLFSLKINRENKKKFERQDF